MGAWDTGIEDNDSFCDVYDEFFTLYNRGYKIPEIKKVLLEEFKDLLEFEEVANEFWFAVAKAQWECKALEPSVYDIVKEIIVTEKDLKIWSELDADDEDLKHRKAELNNFLNTISQKKKVGKFRRRLKQKFLDLYDF